MAKKHVNSRLIIDKISKRYTTNSARRTALHALICLDMDIPLRRKEINDMYCTRILAREYDRLIKLDIE